MLLKLRRNHKKRLQLNLLGWAKWQINKKIQKVKTNKKFRLKINKSKIKKLMTTKMSKQILK
jgi:hypothetical protein